MRKFFPVVLLAVLAVSGCTAIPAILSPGSSSGQQQVQQLQAVTQIHLAGQNYRIVKTNITGSSWGFNLLGLFPLWSPDYVKAVEQLYDKSGIAVGRPQAIANVAQQDTADFFLLFSLPRITLRADLIEFTGPVPPSAAVPQVTIPQGPTPPFPAPQGPPPRVPQPRAPQSPGPTR